MPLFLSHILSSLRSAPPKSSTSFASKSPRLQKCFNSQLRPSQRCRIGSQTSVALFRKTSVLRTVSSTSWMISLLNAKLISVMTTWRSSKTRKRLSGSCSWAPAPLPHRRRSSHGTMRCLRFLGRLMKITRPRRSSIDKPFYVPHRQLQREASRPCLSEAHPDQSISLVLHNNHRHDGMDILQRIIVLLLLLFFASFQR